MKLRKIIGILFLIIPFVLITSCSKNDEEEETVKVIFNLEGGEFQNCTLPVTYYYQFKEGTTNLIKDPATISNKSILRAGYYLDGWYKVKTEANGEVSYTEKWDFETDRVGEEGVELYAYWKKNISYTYDLYYKDEDGKDVLLGSYPVSAGATFDDYGNYYKKRVGYTKIAYLDEAGNLWDDTFTHPGGEESLTIKVYASYIEGDYAVVTTARELKAAKSKNIYLAADIDLEGENFSFSGYNKTFLGNGHKIYNFVVNYDATKSGLKSDYLDSAKSSLYISIFDDLKNATIKDVTFDEVSVNVKTKYKNTYHIYIMPVCCDMTSSTIENVSVNISISIGDLPDGFDQENSIILIADQAYYQIDDESKTENIGINIKIA